MKDLIRNIKYKSIILLFSIYGYTAKSQIFRIQGTVDSESPLKVVTLYRWIDSFNQELIAEDSLKNNTFFFTIHTKEPDMYFISSPNSLGRLLFIVDEDISININNEISESKIINSKINQELISFWEKVDSKCKSQVERIEIINNLININKNNTDVITSLNSEKSSIYSNIKQSLMESIFDYVKKNSDSFISLFLLTRTGTEVAHAGFYESLQSLSPYLKRHSRAKLYLK